MALEDIYKYFEKEMGTSNQLKYAKLSKCQKNYFQISLIDNNEAYDLSNIHFEVRYLTKKYRLDIHFEKNNRKKYKLDSELNEIIKNPECKFTWFKWHGSESLTIKEEFIPEIQTEEKLFKLVEEEHEKFNHILVSIAKEEQDTKNGDSMNTYPLNQILYGPPGTGKTYNTINKALEIIDGVVPEDREEAREKFNKYRDEGQIEFVTFHQSYGYEEFVEGIKADLESEDIKYKLEDGIFKRLVHKATLLKRTHDIEDIDFSEYLKVGQKFETMRGLEFEIIEIENKIKIKTPKGRDISIGRDKIIDYLLIQDFDNTRGHYSYHPVVAKYIFEQLNQNNLEDNTHKNYILIIDEINRGNISKIFGELITLIEPSKRIGADEALRLTLPNSKEPFGVPSNLYIIGTMNTADRSIAQIDTALRRRFEFVEMMPKPELLDNVVIEDIEISEVLKAINERIEYIYDREHTIGHSYFLPLIKEPTKEKLDEIFRVNILPLLAEYFYGDWADVIEVLNDNGFVIEKKLTYATKTNRGNKIYKINELFDRDDYIKIYNTDEK